MRLAGTTSERVGRHHSTVFKASGQLARLPHVGFIYYDFAHNNSLVGFVMQERKQFVVTCKDCHRAVPTGVKEFPFHSIEVTCPLCGEKHRYLPSEVFLGRRDYLVPRQRRSGG